MSLPYDTRRALETIAAELRTNAAAAKDTAARHEIDDRTDDAERWAGRADGLMEAHGLVMAALTAGQPSLCIGDEVRFLWPEQAAPQLVDIDCHYDVMHVQDGMVAVKRVIWRSRGEMRGAWHWAPLTAVERVHLNTPRCPDEPSQAWVPEGGA